MCAHIGDKEDGLAVFVEKHKFEIHHVQHIDFDRAGDRVALLMHVATKWNRHDVPLMQRVCYVSLRLYSSSLDMSMLYACI